MQVPAWIGWPMVALGTYGALWWAAGRAVFHPMKYPQGWWELQESLQADDVWLTTADGVRLHAWWVAAKDSTLATLLLHGNAGNLTHRTVHIGEITAAGSSILVLDYRGYGKSQGKPNEQGLYRDSEAAYEYLKTRGYEPGRIIVHGESLGSVAAIELASRKPCAGVILEAPFTSARDVAGQVLPLLGPLLISGLDARSRIGAVKVPKLFIHGDRDEVISFELGQALYDAAPEPKSLWKIAGAGHNDLIDRARPEYRHRLSEFYRTLRLKSQP